MSLAGTMHVVAHTAFALPEYCTATVAARCSTEASHAARQASRATRCSRSSPQGVAVSRRRSTSVDVSTEIISTDVLVARVVNL